MSGKDGIYCIILTRYRLLQGIALCRSLARHAGSPQIYILCMDDETYSVLDRLGLNNVVLVKLEQIEDNQLRDAKKTRKLNEYCWTIKPYLIGYLLNSSPASETVTYLDADLYFYSSPEKIYSDASCCSVLLTRHNYNPGIEYLAHICGIYNSGFISVKNCSNGINCIRWWGKKCLERCSETAEAGLFGDQKYLDAMPVFFKNVCTVKTPGVNIAPWNHTRYQIRENNGTVYVNSEPLIFYHFSGFRLLNREKFTMVFFYDKSVIKAAYKPYLKEMKAVMDEVSEISDLNRFFTDEKQTKEEAFTVNINDLCR